MSKNPPLPKTESPELAVHTAKCSKARAAAINQHIATGYLDDEGKVRPIRTQAHAEFLARAGTLPALPE